MIEIIPAILPKSWTELERGLESLQGVAPVVQIDLVGSNVLLGQHSLPLWEEFDFECDIMLKDPAAEMQSCIDIGATRVVVHAAADTAHEALQMLQEYRAGDLPLWVGIALQAHDTPEVLEKFSGLYDYVQVMGIDHEGSQGEPADPHHRDLALVAQLRARYADLVIQVDGAVTLERVQTLVAAGANRLVVGSAIVRAQSPSDAYKALYTKANGTQ